MQRDGWHHNQRFYRIRIVITEVVKTDEKLLFQYLSAPMRVPLNYFYLTAHYWCYIISRCPGICWWSTEANEKGERKRMSDSLIKRSWTVIMTHLSAAPDPKSSNMASRTSIRACICLWVSITALIPGGIRQVSQRGAIKTPGGGREQVDHLHEDTHRWTDRPGEKNQMDLNTFSCSTSDKRDILYWIWCQKMPKNPTNPAKQEVPSSENSLTSARIEASMAVAVC